ncbi:MAG TPA: DUF92 domain-containing protein [Anaerolineales bacterium]|nr:DUF92 domain-containing protein [Anaerolineales bacterium]
MQQLFLGFLFSALIAYLAFRAGALAPSGAWAAMLSGGLIFGLGGIPWAVLLLTFFISSSLLSRAFAASKFVLAEKFAKGSRRDYGQVLANGGLGALLALLLALLPLEEWPWIAFAGAMAAVNADTWATELGVLSASPPRLITNRKVVERGTSGGITLFGNLAALAGAALIGFGAALFTPDIPALRLMAVFIVAGFAGATLDSFLGASVQAIYYCPQCQKETESHPRHRCGTETVQVRGWRWLNNDLVNFSCSLVGASVAAVIWWLLF